MNLAVASGNTMMNALSALAASGTLVLYSGTQPATPETALSGNTVLATFTFNSTPFSSSALSGSYAKITASFVNPVVTPATNGTVSFARMFKSDGTTVIGDFTVGSSGTDIIVGSTAITTTVNVNLSSLVLQIPVV